MVDIGIGRLELELAFGRTVFLSHHCTTDFDWLIVLSAEIVKGFELAPTIVFDLDELHNDVWIFLCGVGGVNLVAFGEEHHLGDCLRLTSVRVFDEHHLSIRAACSI